jgi:hypothetical protein
MRSYPEQNKSAATSAAHSLLLSQSNYLPRKKILSAMVAMSFTAVVFAADAARPAADHAAATAPAAEKKTVKPAKKKAKKAKAPKKEVAPAAEAAPAAK